MSKIILNFFGEIISIEKPNNLSSLRNQIAKLYCLSSNDAKEIILTYNENGDKLIIVNDDDLKAFLNSKITTIDLDISQSSQIYKDNLNQLKEQSLKDKKALEDLLKRNEELNELKKTMFEPQKKELKQIQAKIEELSEKKRQIMLKMNEGTNSIEKERKENNRKIVELQKKLGLKKTEPKNVKPEYKKMTNTNINMMQYKTKNMERNFPTPPSKRNVVENKLLEQNKNPQKSNDLDKDKELKIKAIDEWGKCILSKTHEVIESLTQKFKIPSLNILEKSEESKKLEKNEEIVPQKRIKAKFNPFFRKTAKKSSNQEEKKEKEEQQKILIPPKRNPFFRKISQKNNVYPGRKLNGIRPEGIPKKRENYPTMGNTFEKEKIENNKIVHFGVKCDGCGKVPIVGCRYKCAICENFDYCEECENRLSEKHFHPFLKIYEPKMNQNYFK